MRLHPAVRERLDRLAPDQLAAATAPPGPTLCIAPAGSGKTTTLVARIAWLIASGAAAADEVAAISFNKKAADELSKRLAAALEPLGVAAGALRVRTFHALGLEILRDAGLPAEQLVDRGAVLRRLFAAAGPVEWLRLDTAFSRLKLDLAVEAADVARDPEAGPTARAFVAYEAELAAAGALDFDDLVARALRQLGSDPVLLERWRARCGHLVIDEAQDLDRAQLRLALLLAAPANCVFFVGDDDQSIYGWRLADVRRLLALDAALPGLRRVDLAVNYRCPAIVIGRSVRLIEHNVERFAKQVRARAEAPGSITLAADGADESTRLGRVFDTLPSDGSGAILARTNRELLPAMAVALDREIPFRPPGVELLVVSPLVGMMLDEADAVGLPGEPLLVTLEAVRRAWARRPPTPEDDDPAVPRAGEIAAAVLAWAVSCPDLAALRAAIEGRRAAIERLCRDDAPLTLATAHGTKGLEFDHVAVIGLDAGRFPSRRSVTSSDDPARALEEERRLAYVAWTRARRTLTLVYDPASPSQFLLEAFDADELGLADADDAA
jgi:superfamily I DNA/RNA helicase